ncbi:MULTISPECIES: branched-chain amino acid ABC transporter permease [Thalassospira]|jgi:branched-chain amino acid transport system permease protein|uniref:Branched-chain amino acid ABC transporter permease n=2 Tax=Thalassospira TaxID=168934 RepID=A0A2N3L2L9_9PROT|nr:MULTISPECIES: branched-chain amino acid ABC transporter permease [Thalassospira]PKR57062.1 branched-chain amino acid ABC transporter permease [Thalassospira lohafexi]RCK20729.1 ABC transporter permease [Thalassospira lucentensis MCCC 1A00383 = DSM 14000]|tara:strand:- start:72029 stop:73015 length:987 start_codon:yes stop_codon:yes gene_type:complete
MTMNRETFINCILGLALVIVPLIALGMDEPFIITLATKVAIFAMAGVGLNLVLGYGGLVSFGHAAFFGIGGYAAGILASHALNYEPIMTWPFEIEGTTQMIIIWIVALLASAIIALAIGAITLRTSGVYFIMITLAFAQMIYYFAISWPAYGGEDGLSIYVRNGFPGLNTLDPISYFALCAVMLGLAIAFSAVLIRSRFGLALQGARQNSQRMTAVGIAPFRIRLVAFVISAMITALAGALYADLNRFVSPSMMSWHMSGEIMVFVILGGVGRLFGPLAGAGLYIILEHLLGGVWEFWQLPLGVLLLIVVLFARGGLVGVLAGERKHV